MTLKQAARMVPALADFLDCGARTVLEQADTIGAVKALTREQACDLSFRLRELTKYAREDDEFYDSCQGLDKLLGAIHDTNRIETGPAQQQSSYRHWTDVRIKEAKEADGAL